MMRAKGKTACRRIRIYVAASDGQLDALLLLIGTQAVVLCEQLVVITDDNDGHSFSPFRKITFAVPSYLLISAYQVTDWLMSLSLFGGQIGTEDFLQ
ncbi:hypothetical protein [Janthinobacterium sp.]|uniref:hypothetical protein n=1 Tax=Janthinobacterium sp. TaxID=1871054 RepID=UPI0028978453|nr:hypothetical protein [Janthinobacterium sp.]